MRDFGAANRVKSPKSSIMTARVIESRVPVVDSAHFVLFTRKVGIKNKEK
jgi:hypothetical protein